MQDKDHRAYYEVVFERDFLRKKGNAFQDFFADLMEKRYTGGDFVRVRPWGKAGDRKNDGYLKSQRTLFQVYAPNQMEVAKTLKKIDDDFKGAIPHWEEHFDTWIFVHNAREGLGPDIVKKLLDLDQQHENVAVKHWGYGDLRRVLFELSEEDIASFLGPAPSVRDYLAVGYEDLKAVLDFIQKQTGSLVFDIREVPRDKVRINRLSQDAESLINAGRRKSAAVGQFLTQYPDPEYGDQIVEAFKAEYERLKSRGIHPDGIFSQLQVFAGGERTRDPKHQAAVLSVLAYLFDQCDIFEAAEGRLS